ncbi:hypothetical protein ACFUYE_00585 [Micromonospora humida]|uniref:hypothetical protein n=1 Tax=Micromonospora humida TaxID=2809018 RepID=UPI00366E9DF6
MAAPRTYRPPVHHIEQIRALQAALTEIAALAEQGDLAAIRSRATETADPDWAPAESLRRSQARRAARRERFGLGPE